MNVSINYRHRCGSYVVQKSSVIQQRNKNYFKNIISEIKGFCILLVFLLITTALLIAFSIYCYMIQYKAIQKHLPPFYITNKKLQEVDIIKMESNY